MASTRDIKAGRAYVELSTKNQLARGLHTAEKQLKAWGASVRTIGLTLGAVGAAIVAPIGAATRVFASMGDEVNKASQRTGIAVESLSSLKYAADQSGASLEELEKATKKMARTIVDAAEGSESAQRALAALGLSVSDLMGLKPDEQFRLIGDRLSKVRDATLRAALAQEVFGRSGTQLLPLLADGAKGLKELERRAHELGLVISGEDAEAATRFGDILEDLWKQAKMVTFHVGAAVARSLQPFLEGSTRIVAKVIEWVRVNRGMAVSIAAVGAGLVSTGAAVVALGFALTGIGATLGALASALGVAGAAFAALVSPIGVASVAVASFAGYLIAVSDTGRQAADFLGAKFADLSRIATDAFSGIADALAAGEIGMAARLLWAELQLAWQQGIRPLEKLWNDFSFSIQAIAIQGFAGLQKAWVHVRDYFEREFPNLTAFISKAWARMIQGLGIGWETFNSFMTNRWLDLMGLFDETFDVSAAKALNQQQHEQNLKYIDEEAKAAIREADRRRARSDTDREAEKAAALEAIEAEKNKRIDGIAEAHDAATQALVDEIAALKKQLADLRAGAKSARQEIEGPAGTRPVFDPASVADAIDGLEQKTAARGTFNAAAIQGLEGGVQDRIANATELSAKLLKELLKKPVGLPFI